MEKQVSKIQLTTIFKDPTVHKQVVSVLIKELEILSKSGVLPVEMSIEDLGDLSDVKISWEEK